MATLRPSARRCLLLAGVTMLWPVLASFVLPAAGESRVIAGFIPTRPGLPIAVADFDAVSPELDDVAIPLGEAIRSVLQRSDSVYLVSKRAFVEGRHVVDARPNFPAWRSNGVEALVVGRISALPDGRLQTEVRVWDMAAGRELLARAYVAPAQDWSRVPVAIAGDIYERLQ